MAVIEAATPRSDFSNPPTCPRFSGKFACTKPMVAVVCGVLLQSLIVVSVEVMLSVLIVSNLP
jgi:hypothetical protein